MKGERTMKNKLMCSPNEKTFERNIKFYKAFLSYHQKRLAEVTDEEMKRFHKSRYQHYSVLLNVIGI